MTISQNLAVIREQCCHLSLKRIVSTWLLKAFIFVFAAVGNAASGQGTAFTYQGRLSDNGNAVSGTYDLRFAICDSADATGNLCATNFPVAVSNGMLFATLDFGRSVFSGPPRWLEIAVRTNGSSGDYQLLRPRQALASAPYAITAGNLNGTVSASQISGTIGLAQIPDTVLTTDQANDLTLTGSFIGNGAGLTNIFTTSVVAFQPQVIAWGDNYNGQTNVPPGLDNVVAISAGYHTLALRNDGTVVSWGLNDSGQTNVPAGLRNVAAVSAGSHHSLALKNNSTVAAWGEDVFGQLNIPPGLSNVVAISAASGAHNLALKRDGTVVAWGYNFNGQTDVPADLSNVVAIAAGGSHSLALKRDGTVVAWGRNTYGQRTIPAGLSNVKAIAAGLEFSLALKRDGTVVAWGAGVTNGSFPHFGQSNVPAGLSNVTAIAAGGYHSLALRLDGTIAIWGDNSYGQLNVPGDLTNVVALAGGILHSVCIRKETAPAQIALLDQPSTFTAGIGLSGAHTIEFGADMTGKETDAGKIGYDLLSPDALDIVGAGNSSSTRKVHFWSEGGAFFEGDVTAKGIFSGNGSGLTSLNVTNVNASNITTGTVADARLSVNVALLNRSQTFSEPSAFNAPLAANGGVTLASNAPIQFGAGIIDKDPDSGRIAYGNRAGHALEITGGGTNQTNRRVQVYGGLSVDGKVSLGGKNPSQRLEVVGNIIASGTTISGSDRNATENITAISANDILEKVAGLPISRWNYKDDPDTPHLGPLAQDFYAAFGLGTDDQHISTVDADGVALAAVQALAERLKHKLKEKDAEIAELQKGMAELKDLVARLAADQDKNAR